MKSTTFAGTAGHALGTIVRSLLWFNAQIDWQFSLEIAIETLKSVICLVFVAGQISREGWEWILKSSEQLGRWYAAKIVPAAPRQSPLMPPHIHPLALMADELAALTARELREIVCSRRKLAKTQLIALAVSY